MPYTAAIPLQMCLIYHLNPYPRATRSYHSRLDVIRKKTFLLETKISECDDFIGLCDTYLANRYRKKERLEAEQTTVAVGSPRAKRISFAIKLMSEYIGKVEKQLREAKVVKQEGEDYSEYSNLLFFWIIGGLCLGRWRGEGGGEEGFVLMLTFWGPLVDRLGGKELKLVEKEDRKTKKVEENKVKKAKNRGKERLRLGHVWGSMTMRHGLVG